MDLATKLFSLSFGVEPNKATLKEFADILNSAVLSLSEKQKAISDYAESAQTQTYVAAASQGQKQQQPAQFQRVQKPQVVWQIPEEKMKELLWKRAQLIQLERAKAARENRKAGGVKGGEKKAARPPPPKLGKPKRAQNQGASDGGKANAPQTNNASQKKPTLPSGTSPASQTNVAKVTPPKGKPAGGKEGK